METRIHFDLKSFGEWILKGKWNSSRRYLSSFLDLKEEKDVSILFELMKHPLLEFICLENEPEHLFEYLKTNEMIQLQQLDNRKFKQIKKIALEDDPINHPILLQNKFGEGIQAARNHFKDQMISILKSRFPLETSDSSLMIHSEKPLSSSSSSSHAKITNGNRSLKKYKNNFLPSILSNDSEEEFTLKLDQVQNNEEIVWFGRKKAKTSSQINGNNTNEINYSIDPPVLQREEESHSKDDSESEDEQDLSLDLNATPEKSDVYSPTFPTSNSLNNGFPSFSFQSKLASPPSSPPHQSIPPSLLIPSSSIPSILFQSSIGNYSRDPRLANSANNQFYLNFPNEIKYENNNHSDPILIDETEEIQLDKLPMLPSSKWENERKYIIQKRERDQLASIPPKKTKSPTKESKSPSKKLKSPPTKSKSPPKESRSPPKQRRRSRSPPSKRRERSPIRSSSSFQSSHNKSRTPSPPKKRAQSPKLNYPKNVSPHSFNEQKRNTGWDPSPSMRDPIAMRLDAPLGGGKGRK
eukprot:TRINITY_DN1124_c0_g3_i2.p1 TRINITY_DN1124_c0_g3~~TRINITY_DN1124_c0_g3_i2.p1  ORF type:complete len:524 (+),score=206.18 TRINITY_DN1124_c0_g3_i2:430-2001(+)